jgi:hypothetical protein
MSAQLPKGWCCPALALSLVASTLSAQVVAPSAASSSFGPPPYYGYGGYGYGFGWGGYSGAGSTAAGSYLAGLGQTIRAQGQYNLMSSEAAINLEEARKRDIENRERWTNTYFEMRRINKAYRDAERGPRLSTEAWVRMAHDAAPKRLASHALDPVTGQIAWPTALRADAFSQDRETIDQLFAERAATDGAVGIDTYTKIRAAIDDALAKLKDRIRDIDTRNYVEARTFLTGLAREADYPSG